MLLKTLIRRQFCSYYVTDETNKLLEKKFLAEHQEFTFCVKFPSRFEARRPVAAPISFLRPIHSPFDAWFQLQASLNHKTVLPHPKALWCERYVSTSGMWVNILYCTCKWLPSLYLCKHLIPCVVLYFIISKFNMLLTRRRDDAIFREQISGEDSSSSLQVRT